MKVVTMVSTRLEDFVLIVNAIQNFRMGLVIKMDNVSAMKTMEGSPVLSVKLVTMNLIANYVSPLITWMIKESAKKAPVPDTVL